MVKNIFYLVFGYCSVWKKSLQQRKTIWTKDKIEPQHVYLAIKTASGFSAVRTHLWGKRLIISCWANSIEWMKIVREKWRVFIIRKHLPYRILWTHVTYWAKLDEFQSRLWRLLLTVSLHIPHLLLSTSHLDTIQQWSIRICFHKAALYKPRSKPTFYVRHPTRSRLGPAIQHKLRLLKKRWRGPLSVLFCN